MNKNNIYVLIMAGGEGTRFYPLSTPDKPKQFLKFWGDRTFLQETYDRISSLVINENIYVATNEKYVNFVTEQLPQINNENIIGEPFKKNTAPCIAYAAQMIINRDKDAVIIVLPSDHVISDVEEFLYILERAIYIAVQREVLVTLGITPTWPADCYGYIKTKKLIEDDPNGKWHAYTVDKFIEKPSVDTAKTYIEDADCYWNSGIFVWHASVIIEEIQKYLPDVRASLGKYCTMDGCDIKAFFNDVEAISIDYGIMERSDRVVTVPCTIGWNDIGTWKGLYYLSKDCGIKLSPNVHEVMLKQIGS